MICGMPGQFNTGNLLNLFFTLTVMAIFLLGCTFKQDGSVDTSKSGEWSVELREEEHKTIKHPNKKTYATIQTDGLQVSFQSDEVHFPSYTFAHKEFHLGEPVFLSSPAQRTSCPCVWCSLRDQKTQKIITFTGSSGWTRHRRHRTEHALSATKVICNVSRDAAMLRILLPPAERGGNLALSHPQVFICGDMRSPSADGFRRKIADTNLIT